MAKKQATLSLFKNRVIFLLLTIAVVFMGVTALQLLTKERQAKARKDEVVRELASIQARHQTLERDLALLETDHGREAFVRSNADVAQEGEEVYVVLDSPDTATTTPEEQRGVLGWFKGLFR